MAAKPNTVVIVVNNTGRRRWEVARTITALISSCGCELRTWLKVIYQDDVVIDDNTSQRTATPTPVSKGTERFQHQQAQ